MDIQSLIDLVMSDEKLNKSKSMQNVYRDEPILRPASQMENYIPPEYGEMKKIAEDSRIFNRPMEIFYRQAKLMEHFEDSYEFHGSFFRYFPTYQAMRDGQLRGYFSWRTKVRHGAWPQTPLSFVYVHIYELLNQIGAESPENGFRQLQELWEHYRGNSSLDRNMEMWLTDYAVYYNLPCDALDAVTNRDFESAVAALRDGETADEPLFEALCRTSSYDILKSRFCKQYPEETAAVCCRVFRNLSAYYEKNRKQTLCEKYFGRVQRSRYHMFVSAVFAPQTVHPDADYAVGPLTNYICRDGIWWREGFCGKIGKSHDLGVMMKSVDYVLRQQQNYPYPLKNAEPPKYLKEQIEEIVSAYYEEKRKAKRPVITVDLGKLTGIRQAAATTRDSLLTEEDVQGMGEELPVTESELAVTASAETPVSAAFSLPEPTSPQPAQTAAVSVGDDESPASEISAAQTAEPVATACDWLLDETERVLLAALLQGQPYGELLRRSGKMLSVITDSINEKLFDEFYDTVLEFEGENPVIVEDYREDLARRILP